MTQVRRILCIRNDSQEPFELPFQFDPDDNLEVVETNNPLRALAMAFRESFDGVFVAPDALLHAIDFGQLVQSNRILEEMPDGVALIDEQNRIIWANKRISEWCQNDQTTGQNFYELFDNPDILGPDYCPFHTALTKTCGSHSTLRVDETYYQLHAAPVFGKASSQPNLIVTLRDVTSEFLQRQKLESLHAAGKELADLTPEEILNMDVEERIELLKSNILMHTQDLLNFDVIEVRLLNPKTKMLDPLISVGIGEEAANRELCAKARGNGVTGFVVATGKSYLCEDTENDPIYVKGLKNARSSLTVPLIFHDEVIGSFNVESPEPNAFSESDLKFLEIFSRDTAVALNTLELLVAQKADALQRGVEAIHGAVAKPIDEILNDAVNVIEKYIGHDPAVVKRLQAILKNARDIKQVIQNVGEKMTPSIAVPPSMRTDQRALLKSCRVLVIDSDEAVRNDAHRLLAKYGCIVETAHEGDEALMMIRNCEPTENYQAIIADIRLPDMNGYELICRLKEYMTDPPLILMTGFGYDPGHSIVKARREGLRPNAILYKPFRLDQLLSTVESMQKACAESA